MVRHSTKRVILGDFYLALWVMRQANMKHVLAEYGAETLGSSDAQVLQDADDVDDSLDDFSIFLSCLERSRYLVPQIRRFQHNNFWERLGYYAAKDDYQYRTYMRMAPEAVAHLAATLSKDPIFSWRRRRPQRPVEQQAMVAFVHLGRCGNGAGIRAIAVETGVSEGSVVLYTQRVLEAACKLEGNAIPWASRDEICAAKKWVYDKTHLPLWSQGWCMVDGSNIPLAFRPSHQEKQYFDRKGDYSFNLQVVNLPQPLRIIDYVVGFRGSSQDSRCWAASGVVKHPDRFLDMAAGEFIWTDLGYGFSPFTCGPYLHSALEKSDDMRQFNGQVSQIRVQSEHVIGALKQRWTCLDGMRRFIQDAADHDSVLDTIVGLIALHNLALRWDKVGEDFNIYQWGERVELDQEEVR